MKTIIGILHIFVDRANILIFCDHQDTESKQQEMEISVVGTILHQTKIKTAMVQQYPYYTRLEKNIVLVIFCDRQDTKSE